MLRQQHITPIRPSAQSHNLLHRHLPFLPLPLLDVLAMVSLHTKSVESSMQNMHIECLAGHPTRTQQHAWLCQMVTYMCWSIQAHATKAVTNMWQHAHIVAAIKSTAGTCTATRQRDSPSNTNLHINAEALTICNIICVTGQLFS
jgi:hypothetical protein